MSRKILLAVILAAAASAVLLVAARRDLAEPHLRLFADMVVSPAAKSQTGRPFQRAKPPRGTVPRGYSPLALGPGAAERELAGRLLKNPFTPSLEVMNRGRQVYEDFCRHCHGAKGRGDGPVSKAFPGFSFSLATKSAYDLPDGTLFHIISYGRNNMPAHAAQIVQADRWAVVDYLRDLQRREIARLGPLAEIPEDPRRHSLVSSAYGRELFTANCASCHGPDGDKPKAGVPTLNAPAVLAIADDAYYWSIITHGRKGTQMPAWESILSKTQIQSLIRYFRTWAPPVVDRAAVLARSGDPRRGKAVYHGHCGGCHGPNGRGGIGNTLNSPTFLALTSPQYFRDTVLTGRQHTAMPASYDFSTADVSDLVAYLGSWAKPKHSFSEVAALLPGADAAMGAKLFGGRCASCHGRRGEGGIGSRLASDSFLRKADDRFLFRAISEGRPGTAMPSWYFLPARDIADIMAFIRGWQKSPPEVLSAARRGGDAEFGRILFEKTCQSCHGPEGRGGVGGQVGNPQFIDSASDEFLWRSIAHGKDDTAMRGFLQGTAGGPLISLRAADIDHLVAYLRALGARERVDPLQRDFPGASASSGQEIFTGKGGCAKCHGPKGEGASGPSLNSPGFLKAASNGFLAATIILGREGTEMQSYYRGGNVYLSPSEVMDVVSYIRSFEVDRASVTRTVERSASSVAEGKILFGRYCGSCHGEKGRGALDGRVKGYAPTLNSKEFLHAADDNFLQATIALGRPNTGMRPFAAGMGGVADLSAADIRKIVSFIRSWEMSEEKP